MTTTTRDLTNVQPYDLPIEQSDAARGANAALRAGKETTEAAREAWARVKAVVPTFTPIDDAGPFETALRRNAVLLNAAAKRTLGIVSSVAGGLWGIDAYGQIFQVDATDHGDDYLRGVEVVTAETVDSAGKPVPASRLYRDDFPIEDVAAFFDSFEAARSFLEPGPARFFASLSR